MPSTCCSASTPATLQDALAIAQASLGNGSTIDFGLVDDGGDAQLRLDLTWERKYGVSQPVSLELGGDQELVGASAGGELSLEASGTVKLRLLLPLTAAAMVNPIANTLVDEDGSAIDFGVKVDADERPHRRQHRPGQRRPRHRRPATSAASTPASASTSPARPTGDDAPSIADFFTGGFDRRRSTNGRTTATAARSSAPTFPVYVSGVQAAGRQPHGDRPRSAAVTTPADVFSGTGTKVALPSGLQKILDGKPFKFDSLAEGLQQYLFYSETALRTASNDGEMPVVGKDLQAGADFMGKTREKLDAIHRRGSPTPATVGGATTCSRRSWPTSSASSSTAPPASTSTSPATHGPDPPSAAPTAAASPTPAADRHDAVRLQGRLDLQGHQAASRTTPCRRTRARP